jgi:serine protease AprX
MSLASRRPLDVSRLTAHLLAAALAATALFAAPRPADAQARRARLSADLAQRIQAGDVEGTTVIFTGTQARVDELAARHGLRVRKRLKTGAVLDVPARRLEAVAADPAVDHLSGNQRIVSQLAVTTQAIGADQVHAGLVAGMPGLTGQGVGIAIVDSGIANVPELRGRIVASVDFTDDKGKGEDEHGHGTHVAGIAAASGVNAQDDTRGVAPGAHLVSLKVLDAQGRGYADDVIEALDWAIANKDKYQIGVINLSLGGAVLQSWRDDPVCQAVERAYRAGIVVVASAGNFGTDEQGRSVWGGITMPGNSPFAITVGALNTHGTPWRSDDTRATFSSRGPTMIDHLIKPDLMAPGVHIRSLVAPGSTLAKTYPELVSGHGRHARLELSGTSMAAPAVSGAVALIRSAGLNKPEDVRHLLQTTAGALAGMVLDEGAGGLNVLSAVNALARRSFDEVTIAGESTAPALLSFCNTATCPVSAATIVWSESETIVWSEARTIVWSEGKTIVWSEADTIVWSEADTIVWSEAATIVWSEAKTIVWSEAGTIVWSESDTIVWSE